MEGTLKNIVLVGMAGVGKSTVGRALSKKINRDFVDIDQEFEDLTKKKISDFFEVYGELEFRKIERKIITNVLLDRINLVISTGGGIFSDNEIRDFIIKKTTSIFLQSSTNTLFNRLKKNYNTRPLLNKGSLKDNIEKLYEKRIKNYMMANHIIFVDNLSVEEVVLQIIKKI